MLTFYGHEISTPCNKVRFVANALNLDYEFKPVDLFTGKNKTEEYLKLHPAGKVPVMVDGDFVLFESNAICRYLAEKSGSELYPSELRQRSLVNQWMDFASIHVGPAVSRVFVNRVGYSVMGLEKDERSLQDGLNFLDRFLPVVDRNIAAKGYLAGPQLSLADFSLLAHLEQAEISSISLEAYPHLKKWREKLQSEEFYRKCYESYAQAVAHLRSA